MHLVPNYSQVRIPRGSTTTMIGPPDLPTATRTRLLELNAWSAPRHSPVRVTEDGIRHWCEAFEDAHRPHRDPEFARQLGHPSLVAPLGSVLSTFVLPPTWSPTATQPPRNLHYDVKAILELPAAVVVGIDVDAPGTITTGDCIRVCQRLASVSAPERTSLGEGRYWTIERTYAAEGFPPAVRETMIAFGYRPVRARTAPSGDRRTTPAVAAGRPLPPLRMPITATRSALVASATRDFSPLHVDPQHARRVAGTRSAFMSREFHIGIVGRYITDWSGDTSRIRRIELQLRRPLCVGDDLTVTGAVVREDVERAELAVEMRNADGVVSRGTAVVDRVAEESGSREDMKARS